MDAPIGSFQSLLNNVSENSLSKNDIKFLSSTRCESDLLKFFSKISLCSTQWIVQYIELSTTTKRKNSEKALKFKNEGNNYFQVKKYTDAVSSYTKAILYSDSDTEFLSLAYGNRSAASYRLGNYEECLSDIEAAQRVGIPDGSTCKLYSRKANCLAKLQRWAQLEQCQEECSLLRLDSTIKENMIKEIKRLLSEQHVSSHVCNTDIESPGPPSVTYGQNTVLVQASRAVDMSYTTEKGRYVTSSLDIQAGDTLIVERPYAAVLLPEHYLTHCHHCFGKLNIVYPCRQCVQVRYCSPSCAEGSWSQYHRTECHYLQLLHSVGIAHLSLRIVLVAGLKFLTSIMSELESRSVDPSIAGLDANGRYGRSYIAVHDLLTHLEDMSPVDVVHYTLTAQLLLKVLHHSGWFDRCGDITDSESTSKGNSPSSMTGQHKSVGDYIGGLLLRHILQLVCNAHAITELQYQDSGHAGLVEGKNQVRVATAIYPTASLMNHSCVPTIISSFQKDVLVVRAVKDVPMGGEIFNCYGPHAKRMGYTERQRCLKEQYFFTCGCEACLKGVEAEMVLHAYRCSGCDGPTCEDIDREPGTMVCRQCGATCSLDRTQMLEAERLFHRGYQCLQENRVDDALQNLQKCLELQKSLLYRNNRKLSETQDCLARCHATKGQFHQASKYIEESIGTVVINYGQESIEAANEFQKLSEILINAQEWNRALVANQKAVHIFEMNYGQSHDSVKILMGAQNELSELIKALKI